MNTTVQIVLALVVPIGWGLLSAYLFDRFREHRQRRVCAQRDAEGGEE